MRLRDSARNERNLAERNRHGERGSWPLLQDNSGAFAWDRMPSADGMRKHAKTAVSFHIAAIKRSRHAAEGKQRRGTATQYYHPRTEKTHRRVALRSEGRQYLQLFPG